MQSRSSIATGSLGTAGSRNAGWETSADLSVMFTLPNIRSINGSLRANSRGFHLVNLRWLFWRGSPPLSVLPQVPERPPLAAQSGVDVHPAIGALVSPDCAPDRAGNSG